MYSDLITNVTYLQHIQDLLCVKFLQDFMKIQQEMSTTYQTLRKGGNDQPRK